MKSDEKNTREEKYQVLCRAIEEAGIPSLRRWILAQEKANGALRDAIRAGDMEAMKQALAHGAKVEWPDCDGFYPVAECVRAPGDGADIGTIKLLIAAGASIHPVHESWKEARLIHDAAGSGKLGMVQFLLSMGEAVDATDCDGCQAIHAAAWGGQRAMVDFLLGVGAKATIPDAHQVALHYAAAFGDMDAAKRLLAEGVSVNQEELDDGAWRLLPIHFAAMHGRMEMARFLVEAGAKLDAHCMWGGTPADMAREKGHVEVAEYLEGEGRRLRGGFLVKNAPGKTAKKDGELSGILVKFRPCLGD